MKSLDFSATNNEAQSFCVQDDESGVRLDVFLAGRLSPQIVSREKIKEAIKQGACTVNEQKIEKVSFKLDDGDTVSIVLPQIEPHALLQQDVSRGVGSYGAGQLKVLYADDELAVIDKPAGLVVHPCPSCQGETLVHQLLVRFPVLSMPRVEGQDGLRPGVVHRLDKDTSGLMVIALTEQSRLALSKGFADRAVEKQYWAIVHGVPEASGCLEEPIGRDPSHKTRMAVVASGKFAKTSWEVIAKDPNGLFSLVKVKIYTGRTHQIRVHMAHLGHPLCGDAVYGKKNVNDPACRQMLHSGELTFSHPKTGEKCAFALPLPDDMRRCLCDLQKKMQRVVVTGNAGCGKSTLLNEFEKQNVAVWKADSVVEKLYEQDAPGWQVLYQRYGLRFMNDDASVNKKRLAHAMMCDADIKKEVEKAIHGFVKNDLDTFWFECEQKKCSVAVAEIPLWFETGWHEKKLASDKPVVMGIFCPDEERKERLRKNRNWTDETIAAVDSWQWPQQEKMKRCHIVIKNEGTLAGMFDVAKKSLEQVLSLQAAKIKNFMDNVDLLVKKSSVVSHETFETRR